MKDGYFQKGERVRLRSDQLIQGTFVRYHTIRRGIAFVRWQDDVVERIPLDEIEAVDPGGEGQDNSLHITGRGQRLTRTHPPNSGCEEHGCVIHNPTLEAQMIGETFWSLAHGRMERICEHGVHHPDPDAVAWRLRKGLFPNVDHDCDGCCDPERLAQQARQRVANMKAFGGLMCECGTCDVELPTAAYELYLRTMEHHERDHLAVIISGHENARDEIREQHNGYALVYNPNP